MNDRQARFVEQYLLEPNAKQAAIKAGYSERTAEAQGSRLLRNVKVARALRKAQTERAEKVEASAEWVLEKLIRNAQAAYEMGKVGDSTRALELIGKHAGMFVDRVDHTSAGEQLKALTVRFLKPSEDE